MMRSGASLSLLRGREYSQMKILFSLRHRPYSTTSVTRFDVNSRGLTMQIQISKAASVLTLLLLSISRFSPLNESWIYQFAECHQLLPTIRRLDNRSQTMFSNSRSARGVRHRKDMLLDFWSEQEQSHYLGNSDGCQFLCSSNLCLGTEPAILE